MEVEEPSYVPVCAKSRGEEILEVRNLNSKAEARADESMATVHGGRHSTFTLPAPARALAK
jgi:hypothetical protein